MKKVNFLMLLALLPVMALNLGSCSDDNDGIDAEVGGSKVPALLFGKWDGSDKRGQSLTFILYKDGTCSYKRSSYVNTSGVYTYDEAEKKITTTMMENGEGAIVYIVELLDSDNLVVKKAAYDTRISYKRDHSFSVD